MNVNRLIWITTTALFGFVGFLMGLSLGRIYLDKYMQSGMKEPMKIVIIATLAVGSAIVLARLGSWLANRFLIGSLSQMKEVSAAANLP